MRCIYAGICDVITALEVGEHIMEERFLCGDIKSVKKNLSIVIKNVGL